MHLFVIWLTRPSVTQATKNIILDVSDFWKENDMQGICHELLESSLLVSLQLPGWAEENFRPYVPLVQQKRSNEP
jgi:hypothetical protein